MSQEEADPTVDGLFDKSFPIEKYAKDSGSGEPQGNTAAMAEALGLGNPEADTPPQEPAKTPEEPQAQQKADAEGQKVVDRYSARIQERAEELYATESRLALKDSSYLDKLISSSDKDDRKMAEKILKRNADTFGASSVEDYTLLKARKAAGDDPTKQQLAVQDVKLSAIEQKQRELEYEQWKKDNKITGDFEKVVDGVHSKYPTLERGELVALAKGLSGAAPAAKTKAASGGVMGGSSAPAEDDPTQTPLARRMLKSKPTDLRKFADDYLKGNLL